MAFIAETPKGVICKPKGGSMEQYTIDDLFGSVNDIYAQFDEGEIPLEEANQILAKCCKAFIQSNQPKEA